MTANKMPEMPPAFSFHNNLAANPLYTADQMRAMYLAGLEAAKACVQETLSDHPIPKMTEARAEYYKAGVRHFSIRAFTNLTALEQEAKK